MLTFPDAELVADSGTVDEAYRRLATELQRVIDHHDCVLMGVMLGGMIPTARLAGLLQGDYGMDYCQVSRYRGTEQGGMPEWLQPPRADLKGRIVLLVDDIFDEGITLEYVASACKALGAERVISTVLVRKRHDRVATTYRPDFVGFEVDDRYVFGCGMDYRHRWRHLNEIYALRDLNS
ncbi:MAG: hypoxanthine-guanine phosphoribosyltransferase [Gammaproteobacteria bacterium]|nr:hypoxanthine-guanine phosphoribosyltransferase [Gammaproteobacteria bacterium]